MTDIDNIDFCSHIKIPDLQYPNYLDMCSQETKDFFNKDYYQYMANDPLMFELILQLRILNERLKK